ncbi:MAG: radical SAM family heme chaperone HemW [Candidatus Sumerlaea chitinivorans]|nr:radical SAM family heme chaperone HemW [Candidatus Sumerlaea chitinivorans]
MEHYVYIHVPFCEKRCPYCDFFKLEAGPQAAVFADEWLDLIAKEIQLLEVIGDIARSNPVATIYFGGGTPSLISAHKMHHFLQWFREHFAWASDIEVTVEMQPGTADEQKIAEYVAAGVNRFSIGAQTFNPALLARLERRHTVEQTFELIRLAKKYASTSIDLICALPGQTLAMWQQELETLLSWEVPHVSVYELTFYRGTRLGEAFERGDVRQSEEDLRIAIFEATADKLTRAGYEHYEISNFAQPGKRSRHNVNYWRLGNYVGLGAGAHSFLFPHRYLNPNNVTAYRESIEKGILPRVLTDPRDRDVLLMENLQMALRLREGVSRTDFEQRFGVDPVEWLKPKLEVLRETGFADWDETRCWLTFAGWLRFDSILGYLA